MKLKTITIIKEQWHPIFVIDDEPSKLDTKIEIDENLLKKYMKFQKEFEKIQDEISDLYDAKIK